MPLSRLVYPDQWGRHSLSLPCKGMSLRNSRCSLSSHRTDYSCDYREIQD
jgi:hypothetical protein